MISIVVLTSTANRHKFFVNNLAQNFNILGIISEKKRPVQVFEGAEESEIVKKHFVQRDEAENFYFKDHGSFIVPGAEILELENSKVNDQETFNWIKDKNPDYIILFGTSIIRSPLLSYFENRVINIHLGLSPYYRGSGTNFWPLVNGQPECVGATIHLAVLKVDAGAILAQVRPDVIIGDGCHDLGCKTIMAGTQTMISCINLYHDSKIIPIKQNLENGLVYKKSDFNPAAVVKMLKNFDDDMIVKYLSNKQKRDAKYPIITI